MKWIPLLLMMLIVGCGQKADADRAVYEAAEAALQAAETRRVGLQAAEGVMRTELARVEAGGAIDDSWKKVAESRKAEHVAKAEIAEATFRASVRRAQEAYPPDTAVAAALASLENRLGRLKTDWTRLEFELLEREAEQLRAQFRPRD